MKKFLCLIVSLAMLTALCACGGTGEPESQLDTLSGTVRYMNSDPSLAEAWNQIAAAYTEEKGVPVEIISVESSTDYAGNLYEALSSDSGPVLFDVHSAEEFRTVAELCVNLTGQKVLNQLITNAYSLSKDYIWDAEGNYGAVGYSLTSYGIMVNKTLLQKAGYGFRDIEDYASLSSIVADIQNRKDELGISAAFSSVVPNPSDRHADFYSSLYNVVVFPVLQTQGYQDPKFVEGSLEQMNGLLSLVNDFGEAGSSAGLQSFTDGKTVFCAGSVNDYTEAMETNLGYENIGFIPLYNGTGDESKQGLCTCADRYWCVNSNSSDEDQKAALDFMSWVAEEEAPNVILADKMGIITPFVNAKTPHNPLVAVLKESLATGRNPVVDYLDVGVDANWIQ